MAATPLTHDNPLGQRAHVFPEKWNHPDTKQARKLFVEWLTRYRCPGLGGNPAYRIEKDQWIWVDEISFNVRCCAPAALLASRSW